MKVNMEVINGELRKICTWAEPECWTPFNVYFTGNGCRIFLIQTIFHNYVWLKKCSNYIKENDYFFVGHWWHNNKHLAKLSFDILEHLKLDKSRFIILCNDFKELQYHLNHGFENCILLNHNAWVDENKFHILPEEKIYDALLIARPIPVKRLNLANKIDNLALLTGKHLAKVPLPKHSNKKLFTDKTGVCKIINQSKCGLCLSAEEGACYSSSEYLLSGIPVVSTESLGGRDIWYTKENSIICSDNEDAVNDAVQKIISMKVHPEQIRNCHIQLSRYFRNLFVLETQKIFNSHNVEVDARKYFKENYYHKMVKSIQYDKIYSYFK